MGDLEIPAEQCTKIFPVPFFEAMALSIMSQAVSVTLEMEDEAESLIERRA